MTAVLIEAVLPVVWFFLAVAVLFGVAVYAGRKD